MKILHKVGPMMEVCGTPENVSKFRSHSDENGVEDFITTEPSNAP
jgi:hypothetical protein